jgi:hypothetical protein
MPTHARAPRTDTPIPGTNGTSIRPIDSNQKLRQNIRMRRSGMRKATHITNSPAKAQITWRWKYLHGELPAWNCVMDDDESTMTRPSGTRMAITIAIT